MYWIEALGLWWGQAPTDERARQLLLRRGIGALVHSAATPTNPEWYRIQQQLILFQVPIPESAAPTQAQAVLLLNIQAACQHQHHPLYICCNESLNRSQTSVLFLMIAKGYTYSHACSALTQAIRQPLQLSIDQRTWLSQKS